MSKGGERKGRTQIHTHGHFLPLLSSLHSPQDHYLPTREGWKSPQTPPFPFVSSVFPIPLLTAYHSRPIRGHLRKISYWPGLQSTAKFIVKILMITTAHAGNKNSLLIGVCLLIRLIVDIARSSLHLFAHLFFSSELVAHVKIRAGLFN